MPSLRALAVVSAVVSAVADMIHSDSSIVNKVAEEVQAYITNNKMKMSLTLVDTSGELTADSVGHLNANGL